MSWLDLPPAHPFGLATLPYGVLSAGAGQPGWPAVRVGEQALPLHEAARVLLPETAALFDGPSLDRFLAAGPDTWQAVRTALTRGLADPRYRQELEPLLRPLAGLTPVLGFTVADYADFYASEHHAGNAGRILRPGSPPLPANWKHLPLGYHGRAGTVVVSGTGVRRPRGQRRVADAVAFGASQRLDFEAEVGYVVGVGSRQPVPVGDFARHVFGVVLLNDWSARDLQAWESVPLGPFSGKSFATSISGWITPLAALEPARLPAPARNPAPLPYLDDTDGLSWNLALELAVHLNGQLLSRPPYASMYWTPAQLLAQLSVNGARVRTGDLLGSGTVSGQRPDQRGSLLELSWGGAEPVTLADGSVRAFLEDGDELSITATAAGPDGSRVGVGEVVGAILPAG